MSSDIEGSTTHSGSITVGVNGKQLRRCGVIYTRGLKNHAEVSDFTNSGSITVNVDAEFDSTVR